MPFEQSQRMAEQFVEHKVPRRLIAIPNGEHGPGGGEPQWVTPSCQVAIRFPQPHLQAKQPEYRPPASG